MLKTCAIRYDDRTLQHKYSNTVKDIYHFFQSFNGTPYEFFPDWAEREHSVEQLEKQQRVEDVPEEANIHTF
jgi:hypothetical protein